ncbi:MAG: ABC transporter permease subunit [Oscillospiraceae bacterium]
MKFKAKKRDSFKEQTSSHLKVFKQNLPLTLLALPAVIVIFIFNYIPLYGIILPFKDFNVAKGVFGSAWSGLKNFEFLVKSDAILVAIKNTVFYNFIFIFLGTAVSVVVALLLYELSKRAVKVYQTALLVPYFMSWVVVAYICNALLDMDNGILNHIRGLFGMEKILWYNETKYWPTILIIANIMKGMGYNAVVYFAALMGVDSSYFEAAKIDGANKFQQMWYISMPMIKSIVIIMVILSVGKIFYGDFGLFYNVPLNSSLLYPATDVIDTYVYRSLINMGNVGMSATTGFCQSILGFIMVLGTNIIVKKFDADSALF